MADMVTTIKDGKVVEAASSTSSSSSSSTSTSSLGKDDFLKLLVTQMQYQDPLNPSTDTQFVAQLAQFSALEQMQNLNQTSANSQAFSLVGKQVLISQESDSGDTTDVEGTVDYVQVQNGKTYLSIEGTLYSIDDLQTVYDTAYVVSQYVPSVSKQDVTMDINKLSNIDVKLSLGSNGFEASSVAVTINGNTVSKDNLSYKDGTLTINKAALSSLNAGTYNVVFTFNDPYTTVVKDKVSLKITGVKDSTSSTTTDTSSSTSKTQEV